MPLQQEVRELAGDGAARCTFVQDNPAYDGVPSSLGPQRSAFSLTAAADSTGAGPAAPPAAHAPADGAGFLLKRRRSDPALCGPGRASLAAVPPPSAGGGVAAPGEKLPSEAHAPADNGAVEEALLRRAVRAPATCCAGMHV